MWVSLEEIKDYIGTTSATKDSLIEAVLNGSQREILNYCKRTSDWSGFEASTGTRYMRPEDIVDLPYDTQYAPAGSNPSRSRKSWDSWSNSYAPNSHTVLWLGADLQSVDTLTNGDATTISSTSYWLEPRNRKPYRYIRLKSDASWSFNTDSEIEVAGTWGYSTAPDPTIKHLLKETCKFLLDSRASGTYDVTAMPDIGQITIPKGMPVHVKLALEKGGYIRKLGAY